jgi:uncharacterized protein DUF4259
MGAWGSGSFENDDASDWLAEFCHDPKEKVISDTLSTIAGMNADEYLEGADSSVGLAAAEIVAALNGSPNPEMPSEAKECVSKLNVTANPRLVSLALKVVERIKTNSELKELWDESENPSEWYDAVRDLQVRLGR